MEENSEIKTYVVDESGNDSSRKPIVIPLVTSVFAAPIAGTAMFLYEVNSAYQKMANFVPELNNKSIDTMVRWNAFWEYQALCNLATINNGGTFPSNFCEATYLDYVYRVIPLSGFASIAGAVITFFGLRHFLQRK